MLITTEKPLTGRVGPYMLTGAKHEVQLRDGSLHWLRTVTRAGVPCQHHRAVRIAGCSVVIVDLTRLAPALAADLCTAPARDVPGTITFNLRAVYRDGLAFERAVADHAEAFGVPGAVEQAVAA